MSIGHCTLSGILYQLFSYQSHRKNWHNFPDYGLICAGIVLSTLPAILLYTLLQENFVAGLTAGAVKS
jgi:ABC-type glycerol-3-phosphate transport system permease component